MKKIIKQISKLKTLESSIGDAEIRKLAHTLSLEIESKKEFESKLLLFFSLNAKDVEKVLAILRKNSIELLEKEEEKEFIKSNELHIADMIIKFNEYSLKKYKVPFHLAAARGEFQLNKEIEANINISIYDIPGIEISKVNSDRCPLGNYPRYVPQMWPWKIRLSFRTKTYQRKEDVGCHFQHGPFNGIIRAWTSTNLSIFIMVFLQGWGGKLAANTNHFFYKWWFVIAVGFTPYHCQYLLWARRY